MSPQSGTNAHIPLNAEVFFFLLDALGHQGTEDLQWAQGIQPPRTDEDFAREVIFVICNSGMRATVALGIFQRCMGALERGDHIQTAFRHPGKSAAIATVWSQRSKLFEEYEQATDKLAFLRSLPWIGDITKYHLAKNFGLQFAKPDVHLQRLASRDGSTPQALCERLASDTGLKIATVDTILWRACACGVLDSRTGAIPGLEASVTT